jgi:uncharacterized membrane-anchored protein
MTIDQKRIAFTAAVILQFVILTIIAMPRAFTLRDGRVITIQTEPWDPWDMFRGDYVQLHFGFTQINARLSTEILQRDDTVFVLLKRDTENDMKWIPKSISKKPPTCAADEITLSARVQYTSTETVNLSYGIERVFIQEGTGREVKPTDKMELDVAVDRDGHAVSKELRWKNKKLFEWRWF